MDLQAKKIALRKIPHGVFIIGVKQNQHVNAFTGTWLTQMSFTPPLVVMGLKKDTISYQMVQSDRVFSVNILGKHQKHIAEHFVKPAHTPDVKLSGYTHHAGTTGAPILDEAIGYFECRVTDIHPGGDHAIVIGEVVDAQIRTDEDPLVLKDTGWHYGG